MQSNKPLSAARFIVLLLSSLAFIAFGVWAATPAKAQWQVQDHCVPIGNGPGVVGFNKACPGAAGTVYASTGTTTDPAFTAIALSWLPAQANNTALCNVSGGAAAPIACTATQLTTICNTFTTSLKGCVPAPVTSTGLTFLRDDGTFAAPSSSGAYTVVIGTGGTSNDTTTVQAAFNLCNSAATCHIACIAGTYTVDTITVYSNTDFDGGSCIFQQRTVNTSVLDINGKTNVRINNCYLLGTITSMPIASAPSSADKALVIRGNSDRIYVTGCRVSRFTFYALYAEQSTNIYFRNNYIFENAFGTWFRGVQYAEVTGNRIDYTAFYNLTPTAAQLTSAIALESTDGHALGISKHVVIANNIITRFPYAQAIFAHAGQYVTVTGNVIDGSTIGISFNTATTDDLMDHITITGNTLRGPDVTAMPVTDTAQACIYVVSGGANPIIKNPTITGNTCNAFNRVSTPTQDIGLGCIVVGYTRAATVSANSLEGCGANGIVMVDVELGATVIGNSIHGTVAVSTTQNGILWKAAPRALMVGNHASEINGANGVGFKVVGVTTNLTTANNGCYDVTTCASP